MICTGSEVNYFEICEGDDSNYNEFSIYPTQEEIDDIVNSLKYQTFCIAQSQNISIDIMTTEESNTRRILASNPQIAAMMDAVLHENYNEKHQKEKNKKGDIISMMVQSAIKDMKNKGYLK
jgi:hypothetical protein